MNGFERISLLIAALKEPSLRFASLFLFSLNVGTIGRSRTKDGFQCFFELQYLCGIATKMFPHHHSCLFRNLSDRFDQVGRNGGIGGTGFFDRADLCHGVPDGVAKVGMRDQRLARLSIIQRDFFPIR